MKKVLLSFAFIAAAFAAQASYLYWQLSPEIPGLVANGTGYTFNGHEFSYAQIVVKDGSQKTVLTSTYDDGETIEGLITKPDPYVQYAVDVSAYEENQEASFYIELIGYDNAVYGSSQGVIGTTDSDTYTYAALADKGFISTTLTVIPVAWTGAVAAPEPTSALLLLLGLAGLALKRQKIAA